MRQSRFMLIISIFLDFNTLMMDNCAKDANCGNNIDNEEGFAVWLSNVKKSHGGLIVL